MFYDRTLNGIWEQNEFGTYPFNADPPLVQTAATNSPKENLNLFDNSSAGAAPGPSVTPINPVMTGTPTASGRGFQSSELPGLQRLHTTARLCRARFLKSVMWARKERICWAISISISPQWQPASQMNSVDVNAIRPFAGYGAFADRSPVFTSNYNSLQASLNRRISHGLTFGVSYTWSRFYD